MMIEQPLILTDREGHRIAAVLAAPADVSTSVAVLCHGFLSGKNSTTNKTLTRMLNERGLATLRFDFFGHGESDGPFERLTTSLAVGQAMAAIDLMRQHGYTRIGLMGSSFGGLVSLLTAAQRTDLACLALKCPVVDFAEELRLEFGEQEMAVWRATGTIPNIMGGAGRVPLRYAFYEDSLRHIAYGPAHAITAPTLIVQGDADEHVPLHQSRQLFDALRVEKRLEMLAGADHQFTRGDDFRRMATLIADWLVTHLQ